MSKETRKATWSALRKEINFLEVLCWLIAVFFLVEGIRAEAHSVEELKYFCFGFFLLIQQQIRMVAKDIERSAKAKIPKTINVFLTKDEYEKMMLVHKEQTRVQEYENE